MAVSENTLLNAGLRAGLIKDDSVKELKLVARRERISLLEAVARHGRFPQAALYQALADLKGIRFLRPRELRPDPDFMEKVPLNLVQRRRLLITGNDAGEPLLALSDPDDSISLDAARRASNLPLQPVMADPGAIDSALQRWLRDKHPNVASEEQTTDEIDATGLFDDIMKEAWLRRASDIHMEPEIDVFRIRMRIDGHLQEYDRPLNEAEGEAVVTRLKVLANLDIAEQRMAQDGGLSYQIMGWQTEPIDIRVATIPTRWGERATLRLLGQETGRLTLVELGMPDAVMDGFKDVIQHPHGIVLVTGPTGSGKSTTLYAALRELDADDLNILTVEDPIEQLMSGISQVQVSIKIGFANTLRSFLRHDPDVILVGEIRDIETAETALKAAMTGHLVLSTLHTNDAISAVSRLRDIGVEQYLIGSTLIGILAQRLIRRLCEQCREAYSASEEESKLLDISKDKELTLYRPKGCPKCLGTGYLGRTGVYEAVWIDSALSESIATGVGEAQLRQQTTNVHSLWQDGKQKVLEGKTSLKEVLQLRVHLS